MPSYPGISSEAFRHPLDREAEQALRSLPGFDLVARKFVEFLSERPQFVYQMGNGIQVGVRQYANVYQIFRECLRDLDITPEPSLFLSQNPLANSYAIGQENPCIVLNTGLLDLLDAAELRCVLSRELGHIKCGHTTLIQMAIWSTKMVEQLAELTFGLSSFVSTGLLLAFCEWKRRAELSGDRAGLLVTDDVNVVLRTLMQQAGGSTQHSHELSMDEFLRQSDRYQELEQDGLNQVYKVLLYSNIAQELFLTHPFAVERAYYLREWANSEEYRQIRTGHYPRVGAEGSVAVPAQPAADAAARSEVNNLRQQIEALQREIDRLRENEK
jgi:Zn-dependent protease with chaperone function